MKKTIIILGLAAITSPCMAQNPRLSLYEEFTGENCGPCAQTNPDLDVLLKNNTSKIVTIKWQGALPTVPTRSTTLYQQNKSENDWRYQAYQVSAVPTGFIDGQSPTVFGAQTGHPAFLTGNDISTAQAISTPFKLALSRQWDATYSAITVTGTITATSTFTANGSFKMRLVMTEKYIEYPAMSGSNGEREFNWVARKSFPDIINGTSLPATWAAAQTQTFSINCPLPSYIWDKTQVEMVAFLQDDGNKKVWQTAIAPAEPVANDAKLERISGLGAVVCATSFTPQVVVKNNGANAITTMSIITQYDGVSGVFAYTGNIAAGATATITINSQSGITQGVHKYNAEIAPNVNGGTDYNLGNNGFGQLNSALLFVTSYATNAPIQEGFESTAFPPTNWFVPDDNDNDATWGHSTAAGCNSSASVKLNCFDTKPDMPVERSIEWFYLPPMNLAGLTSPTLSYDMAYAPHPQANADRRDLIWIEASQDCGAKWDLIKLWSDPSMETAPTSTSPFTPTASQWKQAIHSLPAAYAGKPQVLIKFSAISARGNNFYIDNVNISNGAVSVKEEEKGVASVILFPNPAAASANLSIVTRKDVALTITILNAVGQIVAERVVATTTGVNTVALDTQNFAEGIYSVIISSTEGTLAKKLTVIK